MSKLKWEKLLVSTRRKSLAKRDSSKKKSGGDKPETRTEIERDYDRILFSTPIRRLSDKTQVFPLDKNDSVRTRLTHSHEVSNIARSIGVALVHNSDAFKGIKDASRNIPAMLAAIGLAHDIGNPPFGHQGEIAISSWFQSNEDTVFFCSEKISTAMQADYINFEGNAQALRILTKLQIISDEFGLNITCSTLAALMKYPTFSDKTDNTEISRKKFGAFQSETKVCEVIWEQTGLAEGIRHPLTFVMEAADDIAYSVLDAEDAVKKGLVSYYDLIAFLRSYGKGDPSIKSVVTSATIDHNKHKKLDLSPTELNDISMQKFRVYAIGELVNSVIKAFHDHLPSIMNGTFTTDLIKSSDSKMLCKLLKDFSFRNAYKHKTVLELELKGHKIIHSIMDMLWPAIVTRGDPMEEKEHSGDPFEKYAYGLISENYRRVFEGKNNNFPLPYKRAQLLADMISGMTDGFAIDFENKLTSYRL